MADLNMDSGFDPQDQAEAFDETHNTDEMGALDETRSFEPDLFDDVYDATARDGDADEDDELALDADEYDADELDEDDLEDDEDDAVYLDSETDDIDDEDEEFDRAAGESYAASGELDVEYTGNLDDASNTDDRVTRHYESTRELSDSDVRGLGYAAGEKKDGEGSGASADDVEDKSHPKQEELLDEGIEETFPASDPVSVKHIT